MSTMSLPRAARRTAGLARRHKVITSVTALFIVAIIAVSLATSGSGTPPPPSYPAAAGFTLPALGQAGQQVSLSQYAGKPVILNFWASWCGPCQRETPLLASWYKQEQGKVRFHGVKILRSGLFTYIQQGNERHGKISALFDPGNATGLFRKSVYSF